jgi:hypothetical protein
MCERFFRKVDLSINDPDGCWPWLAGKSTGYGRFRLGGNRKTKPEDVVCAHRYSYEHFHGMKIPDGMVIDHICRNRSCVRPDHLRVVSRKVNVLENSMSPLAMNRVKTHCPAGHQYDIPNTYIDAKGRRYCRACRATRERDRRRKDQKKISERDPNGL